MAGIIVRSRINSGRVWFGARWAGLCCLAMSKPAELCGRHPNTFFVKPGVTTITSNTTSFACLGANPTRVFWLSRARVDLIPLLNNRLWLSTFLS